MNALTHTREMRFTLQSAATPTITMMGQSESSGNEVHEEYKVPPAVRQVKPVDIGKPPSHYEHIGRHNHAIERRAKIAGKEFLTFGLTYWNTKIPYGYTGGVFYHTYTEAPAEPTSYLSSGVNGGIVPVDEIVERLKKDIVATFAEYDDLDAVDVHEIYSYDSRFRCSDLFCNGGDARYAVNRTEKQIQFRRGRKQILGHSFAFYDVVKDKPTATALPQLPVSIS